MVGKVGIPGSTDGPCETCQHEGCKDERLIVETVCGLCKRVIGFENDYDDSTDYGLVHVACMENRASVLFPNEPALVG